MSDQTVYIFVKNALVENVIGADNFVVIDYDSLESFICPICRSITTSDLYCYICEIDWNRLPESEFLVSKHIKFAKEK